MRADVLGAVLLVLSRYSLRSTIEGGVSPVAGAPYQLWNTV
jgi:hypothetical protein